MVSEIFVKNRCPIMEIPIGILSVRSRSPSLTPILLDPTRQVQPRPRIPSAKAGELSTGIRVPSQNRSLPRSNFNQVDLSSPKCRSCLESLESLFCYDKPIQEEVIEEPEGITLAERQIGNNPRCVVCQARGVVLCITCSGSGLYLDSILESQGILVKVRCLGCGGTGNTMCSGCGGRGHL